MKKKILLVIVNLFFSIFILNAEENKIIINKINTLLENKIIEVTNEELTSLYNDVLEKNIISQLKNKYPDNDMVDALSDYIAIKNYEILNVIKLDNNKIFMNYLIRIDEQLSPKNEKSIKMLDRLLYQHQVFFIYDSRKKDVTSINYIHSNYTSILFHKYDFSGKNILYGIGNNSSMGMATTDIYFLAFSSKTLELLFSDCILFSQRFYSKEIEDISFEKDFMFNENSIEIKGKDFDFKKREYISYEKIYNLL